MYRLSTIAFLMALMTSTVSAAELPRRFGPYTLGMGPTSLEKILGFSPVGTCASCSQDENVQSLATSEASALFKGAFNIEIKADGINQLMFYRGSLYSISFSVKSDQRSLLKILSSKFGKPKKDSIKAEGICVAIDNYTWTGHKTIMMLNLYPQQDYSAELYISDKALLSVVNKLEPYAKVDCK